MRQEPLDSQGLLDACGDPAVAAIAERQEGMISAAQLRAAGLGGGAIEHRVRRGRLHRQHRGVYSVGHRRITPRGRLWAAVLACGGPDHAVVSHRSAAALWDLAPTPAGWVELTTLGESRSTKGIRVHRSRRLDPVTDVVRAPDGLPFTSVARTLLDLAAVLDDRRLPHALTRAERLRLLDVAAIERLAPGRGTRRLRNAIARVRPAEPTRSRMEDRFLPLVARAGLPAPSVNAVAEGFTVDFLWPAHRLIAEADGRETHLTAAAFEEDRRRDTVLQVAGYRVVRFTWRQVTTAPGYVTGTVRELLSR